MHILHCIYDHPRNPWVGGGGAVRVHELYRRLQNRVDATIVCGAFPGAESEVRDGIRFVHVGVSAPYVLSRASYAWSASRLLQGARYDAAVFDFSVYTPLTLPQHRAVGVTVHHITAPTARLRWGSVVGSVIRRVEHRMLRQARVFSATSQATRCELRRLVPPDARIVAVGAGVDDQLFEIERVEQDYLLYFGRLDWFQKGLDVLLHAFALLLREHPDLELRIAGRGRDVAKVETIARELGIQENLMLLGNVSEGERRALFAGAKVLLMPSRFEGFGMVAAEAMAAGVPIVATDVGSLPEVIASPASGILVPSEDPKALAEATAELLASRDARAALSKSARVSAERFRWAKIADQHMNFLQQIAARA